MLTRLLKVSARQGERIWDLGPIGISERRTLLSFGAGMSAAYVFIKLLPELSAVRLSFVAAIDTAMPFRGMTIYLFALLGFLAFYGLDHLRAHLADAFRPGQPGLNFKLHVAGFSAYVSLMGYLLVDSLEQTNVSLLFYTLAIAVHFVSLDHSLGHEHGALYDRTGRWILAGMAILGWAWGWRGFCPNTCWLYWSPLFPGLSSLIASSWNCRPKRTAVSGHF